MLTLSDLVWFALFASAISYWWQARGFKTVALQYAAQRCQLLEVQLLDQSVALRRVRLQRSGTGSLQMLRTYDFEFSSTGTDRYRGTVVLAGSRLQSIEMEPHVVIDAPHSIN